MADRDLLMVKMVVVHETDYEMPKGRKPQFKPVVNVTQALRRLLVSQVSDIQEYFEKAFSQWPSVPGVAKVCLRDTAYSKTKRPAWLLKHNNCPIIGGNQLGELYASVTRDSLRSLAHYIRSDDSAQAVSQISTLASLSPYTTEDAMGGESMSKVRKLIESEPLKLQLFQHPTDWQNSSIVRSAMELTGGNNRMQRLSHYPAGMSAFEVNIPSSAVARIASFPGTQLLSRYPTYGVVRTESRMLGGIHAKRFLPPHYGTRFPIVGLIDTGTDLKNARLQRWVHARFEYVPSALQDNYHGSFVAGLLCNAWNLNDRDDRFPSCACKIIDIVAFDKSGEINERDLMRIIRDSVTRYPEARVWNLSFAVKNRPVADHQFSPVAMLLEDLRRERRVSFVTAAGNTDDETPRPWPRNDISSGYDRVRSPADAPTAIVVGGIAHKQSMESVVRENEPSPWTRHGPGAAFLPSPHLGHFSGNCDSDGDFTRLGIISVDGMENLAEDVGTSYASPLVASLLANVEAEVRMESMPHILSHAILMHSAFLNSAPLDVTMFNHVGVGRPPDIEEVLHCQQSAATMIFEVDFGNKPVVTKHDFPIPESMKRGDSVVGEMLMTLAYDPPVSPAGGFEYCLMNVNATLGTLDKDNKLKPRVHTCPGFCEEDRYERELVRYGFKWSPVKFYYKNFLRRNPWAFANWKLRLSMLCRSGARRGKSHVAYLVITMRNRNPDPEKPCRIYDEMIQGMQLRGWAANDLKLQNRAKN